MRRVAPGPQRPAGFLGRPEWRVGDRWVFRGTPAGGAPVVVTHEVVEAGPEGYRVRLGGLAGVATREWTPDLHLRGQAGATGPVRFDPPAPWFTWPLRPAQAWSQVYEVRGGTAPGQVAGEWQAGSTIEVVDVVAGTFYTVRIEQRSADGRRLHAYWYTPLVRYWVRFESYADGYTEELLEWRGWQ